MDEKKKPRVYTATNSFGSILSLRRTGRETMGIYVEEFRQAGDRPKALLKVSRRKHPNTYKSLMALCRAIDRQNKGGRIRLADKALPWPKENANIRETDDKSESIVIMWIRPGAQLQLNGTIDGQVSSMATAYIIFSEEQTPVIFHALKDLNWAIMEDNRSS